MTETRTTFQRALIEAVNLRYEKLLAQDTEPVEFSGEYLAAVEKLKEKSKRRSWRLVNTTAKRLLLAAIITTLMVVTVYAAVAPMLRKKQVRYTPVIRGGGYNFEFSEEDLAQAPKEIQTYYAPTYIPKEFELQREYARPTDYCKIFQNKEGESFIFNQEALWELKFDRNSPDGAGMVFVISADYEKMDVLYVNGYEIRVFRHGLNDPTGDVDVLWTDHEYFYEFSSPNISNEEIEKIILSIEPIEPQP